MVVDISVFLQNYIPCKIGEATVSLALHKYIYQLFNPLGASKVDSPYEIEGILYLTLSENALRHLFA